jgi:hypothetical protein
MRWRLRTTFRLKRRKGEVEVEVGGEVDVEDNI